MGKQDRTGKVSKDVLLLKSNLSLIPQELWNAMAPRVFPLRPGFRPLYSVCVGHSLALPFPPSPREGITS